MVLRYRRFLLKPLSSTVFLAGFYLVPAQFSGRFLVPDRSLTEGRISGVASWQLMAGKYIEEDGSVHHHKRYGSENQGF